MTIKKRDIIVSQSVVPPDNACVDLPTDTKNIPELAETPAVPPGEPPFTMDEAYTGKTKLVDVKIGKEKLVKSETGDELVTPIKITHQVQPEIKNIDMTIEVDYDKPELDEIPDTSSDSPEAAPPIPSAVSKMTDTINDAISDSMTIGFGDSLTKEESESLKESQNDVSLLIRLISGTSEEAKDMLAGYIKNNTKDGELVPEAFSELSNMYRHLRNTFERDDQAKLLSMMLRELKTGNKKLIKLDGVLKSAVSRKTKVNKVLSKKEARLAVMSRLRGLGKIHLISSGFFVDMRPMSLLELSEFFNTVDDEAKEFGRILGGHFNIIKDVFVKSKVIELFPKLVEHSNLEDYTSGDVLMSNISFQDYDTIVGGIVSLMFDKGIEIGLQCSNKKCAYEIFNLKVNLKDIRYDLIDDLSTEAMEFLLNMDTKTPKELKHYRTKLLKSDTTLIDDHAGRTLKYHLQVPTMPEYVTFGENLINELASTVRGEFDVDNIEARNALTYSNYQMFQPWVQSIDFLNDDGSLDVNIDDREAISDALQMVQQESVKFREGIIQYMFNTKRTYMCYANMECPLCKKKPITAVDDFVPVDPQQLFFFLTCHQLMLAELH